MASFDLNGRFPTTNLRGMSATCACLSRRSGQGATGAGRTGSHESMKKLLDPEPLLVPEPAPFWLGPVN